jgi:hypothetical protein
MNFWFGTSSVGQQYHFSPLRCYCLLLKCWDDALVWRWYAPDKAEHSDAGAMTPTYSYSVRYKSDLSQQVEMWFIVAQIARGLDIFRS